MYGIIFIYLNNSAIVRVPSKHKVYYGLIYTRFYDIMCATFTSKYIKPRCELYAIESESLRLLNELDATSSNIICIKPE